MKNVNSIIHPVVHSTTPVHFPVQHGGLTPPLYFTWPKLNCFCLPCQPMYIPMCTTPCPYTFNWSTLLNVWRQFASWRTLQLVCSSSLQPLANPYNSSPTDCSFLLSENCLHGWNVATSRVRMGVVFGVVLTCRYILHHYTAYHYTAIASITSPSSTVTLPSAISTIA